MFIYIIVGPLWGIQQSLVKFFNYLLYIYYNLVKKDKGGNTLYGANRISTFKDVKIRSVVSSCMAAHNVAISTEGRVYCWGNAFLHVETCSNLSFPLEDLNYRK